MDKKILIVDDEENIRDFLAELISAKGYSVTAAESAEEALVILGEQTIRVMSFDLMMPGMKGDELCRTIKGMYPLTIIYALTAHISLFGVQDCIESGFDDVFLKPVDTESYLKAIEHAFEKIDRWTGKN